MEQNDHFIVYCKDFFSDVLLFFKALALITAMISVLRTPVRPKHNSRGTIYDLILP